MVGAPPAAGTGIPAYQPLPSNADACKQILSSFIDGVDNTISFNFGPNITLQNVRQTPISDASKLTLCINSFDDLCHTQSGKRLLEEIHTLSSQQTTAMDGTKIEPRKIEICFTEGQHGSCAPTFEINSDGSQTLKVIVNINEFIPVPNAVDMAYLVNTGTSDEFMPDFVNVQIPISVALAHELGHVRQALLLGATEGRHLSNDNEGTFGIFQKKVITASLDRSIYAFLMRNDLNVYNLIAGCWHVGVEFCNILPFNFNDTPLKNLPLIGDCLTQSDGGILHEILQMQNLPDGRLPSIGQRDRDLLEAFRDRNAALIHWGHCPSTDVAKYLKAIGPEIFREILQRIAHSTRINFDFSNLPRVPSQKTLVQWSLSPGHKPGNGEGGCCNVA